MENKVDVGAEASQSVTASLYYKGYSIMLTLRDPQVKLLPLLEKAMHIIDWAIEKGDFEPSWNTQTNKELKAVSPSEKWLNENPPLQRTPMPPPPNGLTCAICQKPATERNGVSKTTGRPWRGIFCESGKGGHTTWVKPD